MSQIIYFCESAAGAIALDTTTVGKAIANLVIFRPLTHHIYIDLSAISQAAAVRFMPSARRVTDSLLIYSFYVRNGLAFQCDVLFVSIPSTAIERYS